MRDLVTGLIIGMFLLGVAHIIDLRAENITLRDENSGLVARLIQMQMGIGSAKTNGDTK
jgi:hypothetical protein